MASPLEQMKALSALAKAGIVVGGYTAAILCAVGVVAFYVMLTDGPERELSSGMYAFGDSLLFMAVFGTVSIVPTGLSLFFLRQNRGFWIALCVVALLVAGTGTAEVAAMVLVPESTSMWVLLAVPRIFMAPFLAAAFGLAVLIAPTAGFRWWMFAAASMEVATSVYGSFRWFVPMLVGS